MFLWLKLLVFGLALVDMDVFINGQSTASTYMSSTDGRATPDFSLIPSRTTPFSPASTFEAKSGSTTNETVSPPVSQAVNSTSLNKESVAFIATPASLTISAKDLPNDSFLNTQTVSRASNLFTNSSAAATPSPFPFARTHAPTDGGNTPFSATTGTAANISSAPPNTTSIEHHNETCDNIKLSEKFIKDGRTAILNFTGTSDLPGVNCTGCNWDKNSRTISGLKECQTYEIEAEFTHCKKSFSIYVPVDGVNPISGCVKFMTEARREFKVLPNTNYSCNSSILNEKPVDTVMITTDYGRPDQPKSCLFSSTTTNVIVTWEAPQDQAQGPIDGYKVRIHKKNTDVPAPAEVYNKMNYTMTGLKPYTNYSVSVWAFTNTKNSGTLTGDACTHIIMTLPTKPDAVNNLQVNFSGEANNAVKVTCAEPKELNGPSKIYMLKWDGGGMNGSSCLFNVKNLHFLKTYNFTVIVFNGHYSSDPSSKEITTKYDAKAVIGFLAFLSIVTFLALLFVLYKIYILNRKNSRDEEEGLRLVPRDDERQMKNIDPIPAELLWEAYRRKIADEGRLFLDEFQSIPRVFSKYSIKEARKPYNQNKNRYIDILPYDYNRVELSSSLGEAGHDYINASHIDGFKEMRKYIAAQGPKEETTDDFWRMIWEQKATIVVMVTRCEEGNKIKCAKYWPSMEEEIASYGDIIVKINECKVYPDYIIRKLHINHRRDKAAGRDVTHIQFTSWPDHGVPDDPHLLLKLRRRVNNLSNFFSGPIVVHCSAGVGRTGTYIGIDAMLEGLEAEGRVDVYGYVAKLRRQRCLMVQVEAQYILIHHALVEYVQFGETEVCVSELHSHLNQLKKRDSPSDPSLLEAEFQRLPLYKNWQNQKAGRREENKTKNRSSTVIPYDYNRVLFKHEEEGSRESAHDANESSDEDSDCEEEPNKYINASFIPSYWLQNGIIATQGPLPETIDDFWNMVYQRKVKVIVMLTDTQELCAQYWKEEKMTYDNITVELKDSNFSPSYTIRAFELTHIKRKDIRKVFQYQYHKWENSALPETPQDLTTMIQNLKQRFSAQDAAEANMPSQNVPVVVHCGDGSKQTGVFCALLNLMECAETEGVIDVFQVVKTLRRARPGMISFFEDYQFLYDTIASLYPAQNGQLQMVQCHERIINNQNEVKKEEEGNSLESDVHCMPQENGNDAEMCDDSKTKDASREAESSFNGPANSVLSDIA
ncbi:receptor-type tyrosine-protein phosphatase C [Liasis olivaceus]